MDPEDVNTCASWIKADDETAACALQRLLTEDLGASFIYFGECDVHTHNDGTGRVTPPLY